MSLWAHNAVHVLGIDKWLYHDAELYMQGYSDGTMTTFLRRRSRGAALKGPDERLTVRPLPMPAPGTPPLWLLYGPASLRC